MNGTKRQVLGIVTLLLALFLLGTVVVLSSFVYFFGVYNADILTESEVYKHEKFALGAAFYENVDMNLFRVNEDPLAEIQPHTINDLAPDPLFSRLYAHLSDAGDLFIPVSDSWAIPLGSLTASAAKELHLTPSTLHSPLSLETLRSMQSLNSLRSPLQNSNSYIQHRRELANATTVVSNNRTSNGNERVESITYHMQDLSNDKKMTRLTKSRQDTSSNNRTFLASLERRSISGSITSQGHTWKLVDPVEVRRAPKIIHQTWKTDTLPPRYAQVRKQCANMHPDYEYMLWTDKSSREFIKKEFPWFLETFDKYPYNIQRADLIRYFVLYKYGGIYMDIDIGCRRRLDPLLYSSVTLMQTIPVGVSNDAMVARPGDEFIAELLLGLESHQHSYGTHYPTVMFSTGPMYVSGMYGSYEKRHTRHTNLRVLPKRWYGKNAPADTKRDWFFSHYYGSSWHNDDSSFIIFLGRFGSALMYFGLAIIVVSSLHLVLSRRAKYFSSSSSPSLAPSSRMRVFSRRQRQNSFTPPLPRAML